MSGYYYRRLSSGVEIHGRYEKMLTATVFTFETDKDTRELMKKEK